MGNKLLTFAKTTITVARFEFIAHPLIVYALEVESTHTFCVGRFGVVTHNTLIPAASIGLSVAFGSGAATVAAAGSFFGPISLIEGFTIGGCIALGIKMLRDQQTYKNDPLIFNVTSIEALLAAKNKSETTGAQAPGLPTKEDGYIAPKRWNGKKVKNPSGAGYGWPDKKGEVWMPTGPNGHGAPHWDVENIDGSHRNVMPGGHIRGKR